MMMMMVIPL